MQRAAYKANNVEAYEYALWENSELRSTVIADHTRKPGGWSYNIHRTAQSQQKLCGVTV